MHKKRAKENEEWSTLNEPCLAALEAKSSLKSSHLEDLEREKKRLEVEVANLKESLARSEGNVLEFEASNVGLSIAQVEVITQQIFVQEELAYCKSENFKKNRIDNYKSSEEYESENSREASSYLDKGCVHIIHQLHHHFEDKSILLKAFEANFDNMACRRGANFVTYTIKEMEDLKGKDEKRGLPKWTPLLAGSSIFLLIFFK